MHNTPKKFSQYSKAYDLVWKAINQGLSPEEAGFCVIKEGTYLGNQTPTMRQHGDQFGHEHFDQDQKGQGHRPFYTSPRPRPNNKRDDFEMDIRRTFRPSPL